MGTAIRNTNTEEKQKITNMKIKQQTDQVGYPDQLPNHLRRSSLKISCRSSACRCRITDQLALGSKIRLGCCCCNMAMLKIVKAA